MQSAITASTPAAVPPKRRPRRKIPTSANRLAVRLTTSHMLGPAPPKNPNNDVNTTGNGFHDGPPPKLSWIFVPTMWLATSWPQLIHAYGSELGTHGSTSTLTIASTRQAMQIDVKERSRRTLTARAGGPSIGPVASAAPRVTTGSEPIMNGATVAAAPTVASLWRRRPQTLCACRHQTVAMDTYAEETLSDTGPTPSASNAQPDGCVVTIVMPCLNEAESLEPCIRKAQGAIKELGIEGEVLIADNGSTDGSVELAESLGARVAHIKARGYGAALQGGFAAARGKYILMGDADGSYDFAHLPRFIEALDGGSELVMGNRFVGGIAPRAMPPLHRYFGNPGLSWMGRLFFGAPVGDFYCGLRAFRRDVLPKLNLQSPGMELGVEMVAKAALYGLRVSEVPTTLSPDLRSRPPHLRTWRDGWRTLRFFLLYSPRWLFLYPGIALMLVGTTLGLWVLPR